MTSDETDSDLGDIFQKVTGEDTVTSEQEQDERRADEDDDVEQTRALPKTDATCPDCGHERAYAYLQQTRAADESETRFFICVECDNKWRGYD